jgi:hypothetical protein
MDDSAQVVVDIGNLPVRLTTTDRSLVHLLEQRYAGFVNPSATPAFEFDVSVVAAETLGNDADLSVRARTNQWVIERGDFRAEWDATTRRGRIEQTVNPYAVDSVLRIVHTLLLSTQGGFLLHAASAVLGGRAMLFVGPSGAGKTTIARLAPRDVMLLSDEISYVRHVGDQYVAFGTPFAGELGHSGQPVSAPVAAVYRLERGLDNEVDRLGVTESVRTLMKNILFFADDSELTGHVLETSCHAASTIPFYRLAFAPDARVWDVIRGMMREIDERAR